MEHQSYAYGMWVVAAFNIGLFLFFTLSFLMPKGKLEWRSMGVFSAFLVALFAEMYGFPLTIFLLSGWLGEAYPALDPFSHKNGHLWVMLLGGSVWVWALVMGLSLLLLLAGYGLLSKGWRQIHGARGKLVRDGVYAYVRHPQYSGLFLISLAFMVQWPTLLTLIMWPLLILAYRRLARHEAEAMKREFGEEYEHYASKTAEFFPPLGQWKAWLLTRVPDAYGRE